MYKIIHVGHDVMLVGLLFLPKTLSSPSTSYLQLDLIFAVGTTLHILKYISIILYILGKIFVEMPRLLDLGD
jgi:hypothetical protein